MQKLSIYLDTSAINFLYADDSPEKKDITIEYFEKYVRTSKYHHFVSQFVIDEINQTGDSELRNKLLSVISSYPIENMEITEEGELRDLAVAYIKGGIVPENKIYDALHVAFCTIKKIDILLSWNFKHLANINKERKFESKNLELGYGFCPRLYNPMEVYDG